jgi:hypothetical protein
MSVVAYLASNMADYSKRSALSIGEGIINIDELVCGDKSFGKALKRNRIMWSRDGGEDTEFPLPDPNLLTLTFS